MAEGIIFGGYLLNELEFKQIFKEFYQQRGLEFSNSILELLNLINTKQITKQQLFQMWDTIEVNIFGNNTVQFLGMIQSPNSNEYNFTKIVDETEVLRKSSLNLNKKMLLNKLVDEIDKQKAIDLERELNQHYITLLNSLEEPVSREEAHRIHLLYALKKRKMELEHLTGRSYNEIFFTMTQGEGKRTDAYMNHISNHHPKFLSFLSNISNMTALPTLSGTVKEEEGDNFIYLLYNALNSVAWYASGDLVVINDQKKVIYNIQLKSSIRQSQSYHIAFSQLKTFLTNLTTNLTDVDQIATIMYKNLKIQASNELQQGDMFLEEETFKWVKENLKIK